MPEIITKEQAKAQGLRFYCTGKPCCAGHIALRYVCSGACTACSRRYYKNAYSTRRIEILKAGRVSYYKHHETNLRRGRERMRKIRAATQALKELGIYI